jgi:membrane dipeptidase
MTSPPVNADRRKFSVALGAGALAACFPQPFRSAQAAGTTAIDRLYERAIVIDALASPNSFNVPYPPPGPLTAQQLANVRESGISAVNLTVSKSTFELTVREIAFYIDQIERHHEYLRPVRSHRDIAAAKQEGRLGVILGFQGLGMIGSDLSLLQTFQQLGVRVAQLTYNDRNLMGAGSSVPDSEGLSKLGREAVAKLNELRVLVDVSHSNVTTALDVVAASSKPVAMTHTGCRAVFDHQRSAPDTVLRAVAKSGGVVGIYLMPFLGRDPKDASRALFVRHLEHALKTCGEDHVGIGSDQSITPVEITPTYMEQVRKINEARSAAGIAAPLEAEGPITVPELNSARRMYLIADALAAKGHPERVIEKVLGANFHRLFGEIWGV